MRTAEFKKFIWDFYAKNKREFPWRETKDPYAILVSEIMLQQTQTARVVPKYLAWLQRFPTVVSLAEAPLSEVLLAWSGLGYNRRAKFLQQAAQEIQEYKNSEIPNTFDELRELPGIGEYTANAVLAFAFNQPTIVIETNIRTVIIHHFFADKEKVNDKEISSKLTELIDTKNPREWYYALMDYGNFLKTEGINHFQKQHGYTKQKPFKGSERFVRGYILREVLQKSELKLKDIVIPGYTSTVIKKVVEDLAKEGLVIFQKGIISRI